MEEAEKQFMILPLIYISKGKVIAIGNQINKQPSSNDLIETADSLAINSSLILFDYDRKDNDGSNKDVIKKIVRKYQCIVGGGLETKDDIDEYLNCGASKVICNIDHFFEEQSYHGRIIYSIAFNDINLHINSTIIPKLISTNQFLILSIEEPVQNNYSIQLSSVTSMIHKGEYKHLKIGLNIAPLVISGQHAIDDNYNNMISTLSNLGICPVIPSYLITSDFTLGDAYSNAINYSLLKQYSNEDIDIPVIIPVMIIKDNQTPLGITFTDKEGIKESIDKRICVFYSRDRKKKWIKGETSNYYHRITQVSIDFNRQYMAFTVKGNKFCHLNYDSCFHITQPFIGEMRSIELALKQRHNKTESNCLMGIIDQIKRTVVCHSQINATITISQMLYDLIRILILKNIDIDLLYQENMTKRINRSGSIHMKYNTNVLGINVTLADYAHTSLIKNGIYLQYDKKRRFIPYAYNEANVIPLNISSLDNAINLLQNDSIDCLLTYDNEFLSKWYCRTNLNASTTRHFYIVTNKDCDSFDVIIKYRIMANDSDYANFWIKSMNVITYELVIIDSDPLSCLINRLCDIAILEVYPIDEALFNMIDSNCIIRKDTYIKELVLYSKVKDIVYCK